ncbi:hypothetical protein VKT23_011782 [Stygiomarasmius scandens]|uniref:DUF6534 domain-containing protein n=1 Tax=Marasmiellus scandens TaxID=2682957 RepID=A0ABR1J7Z9_9AGAR
MLHFQRFPLFRKHLMWLFSLGLSISAFVDVYITITMFIILKKSREHSLTLNSIIDSMIIYSFENGLMTSVVTVASLLCWVTMDNLVFLGLHFVASKLYANSTLAVFNYRMHLRRIQESNANIRTGQGVVELFVLPNQAVSPSNEEQPNQTDPFALDQSKQLQNEEMHTDDDSAQNYVNNGNPASGIMKSVTVHFHRD